jgi:hypothetical protein
LNARNAKVTAKLFKKSVELASLSALLDAKIEER